MSYSITLRLYQANPDRGYYYNIEKTCWNYANGCIWTEVNGRCTLTMGGSGTSGVLRLKSDKEGKEELITIAVGVHNYKRWCDVVTALKSNQTGLLINGEYYNEGPRAFMREKQLSSYSVTSPLTGAKISVVYRVAEGNNLEADVIIV